MSKIINHENIGQSLKPAVSFPMCSTDVSVKAEYLSLFYSLDIAQISRTCWTVEVFHEWCYYSSHIPQLECLSCNVEIMLRCLSTRWEALWRWRWFWCLKNLAHSRCSAHASRIHQHLADRGVAWKVAHISKIINHENRGRSLKLAVLSQYMTCPLHIHMWIGPKG